VVGAVVLLSGAEGGVNAVEEPAVMKSCNFVQCDWNGNFSCDERLLKWGFSVLKIKNLVQLCFLLFFSCFYGGGSTKRVGYHKTGFLGKSNANHHLFQIRVILFLHSCLAVSA